MNRENLEQEWPDIAAKLIGRFPKLTDADLKFEKGNEEELLMRIEQRLQKSRFDILRLISTL